MTIKIADLMAKKVVTAQPQHTVKQVRDLMKQNRILALPVVDNDGQLLGIVTATDLIDDPDPATPVNAIMTERVYKLPAYNDVSVAARVMRKHKIHHVVVTHEQEVTGIISSFDLLKIVADSDHGKKEDKKTKGGTRRGNLHELLTTRQRSRG